MAPNHLDSVHAYWSTAAKYARNDSPVVLRGEGFDMASLLAISRDDATVAISDDPEVHDRVEAALRWLEMQTENPDDSIYGVNTGFGARAYVDSDTRTRDTALLQLSLIKNLVVGLRPLPESAAFGQPSNPLQPSTHYLAESWVKALIAIRINVLLRGHSGCRMHIIEQLKSLLDNRITPCVPLRQSISASGDLGPLAYVAGTFLEGSRSLVWHGEGPDRKITPAPEALAAASLPTITYGPKEALALVNGTSASCAVAALALHDANVLLLSSQLLTALSVEALNGTPESFDPFLNGPARPHPGQTEVAENIRQLLTGSLLCHLHDEGDGMQKLRQDRYSLRTAPQWIGPQLEELQSALRSIETEMNSTTDNPIIHPDSGRMLHGGNFQGTQIAVAMEKVRIGLGHLGRLAYAQFLEMGNAGMSRGLPPDLSMDEPSIDFGCKSMDIACASYLSELSFLCNTVTNHVQPAESFNQSVNSLALVSARYTHQAIHMLRLIYCNQIFALCQAIDLRAMNARFLTSARSILLSSISLHAATLLQPDYDAYAPSSPESRLFEQIRLEFGSTANLDSDERFEKIGERLLPEMLKLVKAFNLQGTDVLSWSSDLSRELLHSFLDIRVSYTSSPSSTEEAASQLGSTRPLYLFVRETLGVPMWKGVGALAGDVVGEGWGGDFDLHVSRIYDSFESGRIVDVLMECFGLDDVEPAPPLKTTVYDVHGEPLESSPITATAPRKRKPTELATKMMTNRVNGFHANGVNGPYCPDADHLRLNGFH